MADDGPQPPSQAMQTTLFALSVPKEKLLEKSGNSSCETMPTSTRPSIKAYGKNLEEAHLKAGLLCIQHDCQLVTGLVTKRALELTKLPQAELEEIFLASGYDTADARKVSELAKTNFPEFQRRLEAQGRTCLNSAATAISIESFCFYAPMSCNN